MKTREERLRFCRICDITKDIPSDVSEYTDKVYALLDKKERAEEELINDRLKICATCGRNSQGTCLACGCYCIIRSMKASAHCPKRLW